jgi:TP901 family phage tail tape measure protein
MPSLDIAINALRAKAGAAEFEAAAEKIRRAAIGADKSVVGVDKSAATLGTTMGSLGKTMMGFVGFYAISRYLKSAIGDYAKLEHQLAEVSTMLDDQTMLYLPQYRDQLVKLSIQYGESTQTLSRGLYDIISASVDAADALEVLEVSTKAAKAGISDTGIAADAITTVLNSYSLKAKEAGRVSDLLFATIIRGKTTFNELGPSIGQVASLAASAGLSLEEVCAALATMTRAGLQTDIAVTSLKGILTTFLSPQQQAVDIAKKWGLELNTNTLRTKGLSGVIQELSKMSQENIAGIFGNVRALTGLSALLQQTEGYAFDLNYTMNSLGLTEAALEKISGTTAFKLDRMAQAWKAMKRDSVEGLIPLVESWTDIVVDSTPKVKSFFNSISELSTVGIPYVLARWSAAFHDFRAELWDGIVITNDVIEEEKELAERWREAADALLVNKDSLNLMNKAEEEAIRLQKIMDEDFQKMISTGGNLVTSWDNITLGINNSSTAIKEIVIPSEKLTAALVDVEDALKKVQEQIDTFEMSDIEKQIRGLKQSAVGLSGGELTKFNAELDKLAAKGKEFEQLKGLKEIEESKNKQLQQDIDAILLLDKKRRGLEFEKSLIGLTNEEREKAIIDQERLQAIQGVGQRYSVWMKNTANDYRDTAYALVEATAEHEKWLKQLEKEKALREERVGAEKTAQQLIREVQVERELLFLTNEERERAIKLQQLEAETKVLGTERSKELVQQYKEELKELQNAQQTAKYIDELRTGIGKLAEAPLEALLDGTKELGQLVEDELRRIGMNILRAWYDQLITQQIQGMAMSFIGSLFPTAGGTKVLSSQATEPGSYYAAKGRVFSAGSLIAMSEGGVLNFPTIIPLRSGAAIAAENAPEAVMPLTRINGRLGVEAAGGTSVINKIINIIDPKVTGQYLDTGEGERQVVNIIRRNRRAIEVN